MKDFKEILDLCEKLLSPYKVEHGNKFKLKDHNPKDVGGLDKSNKADLLERLEKGIEFMSDLQAMFYAEEKYALLVILQAMDAAGKDGMIKHVMSGVNPQGCRVSSFKQPTPLEHKHDFLWRCAKELPERGCMGIFNRSYYEEVLALKVHPELLQSEGIVAKSVNKKFWKERYESISDFERHLYRNNTRFVKIFLHLSYEEQRNRFISRIDTFDKNWKFSPADIKERQFWTQYQVAFEDMIKQTASPEAPWYVVPADNKWFSRIISLCAILETMMRTKPKFPKISEETKENFPIIREQLEQEKRKRGKY